MNIKVGDKVIVISGSRIDKKKQGKVLKVFKDNQRVIVEGINLKKKAKRDTKGKKSLINVEFPIHVSNVMIYDEKAKKGTRVGYSIKDDKKFRVTKASRTELE